MDLQLNGKKYCMHCGAKIDWQAEMCPQCGLKQPLTPTATRKSRIAAGLFGILLGGLGIHKFYLGKIGWGILYLALCWTFIPALAGLIEGILYLTMSDQEFAAKYEK